MYRPVLRVALRGRSEMIPGEFLVDTGADVSMAPHELFEELDLRWHAGARFPIQGISRRRSCTLIGRLHEVDLLIPAASILMRVPMVFVRGDAPYVLGRDTFFEAFRIAFDPTRRRTIFELVDR